MRSFKSAFAWLLAGCLSIIATGAVALAKNDEPTIYDSRVLEHIEFSSTQRPAVKRVLDQSDRELAEIFKRFAIDPYAKPDFDKLRAARYELEALGAWEKREMKKIMTRAQFKYYVGLVQQTTARVIKATRNRP